MYEFEIRNKLTGETDFIFGYTWENAWNRNHSLNENDWTLVYQQYID